MNQAWLEVSVESHPEAVESVAELFARFGFNEGVVIEEPFLQDGDGDNLRVDLSRPVIIRTFLAKADVAPETIEAIKRGLFYLNQIKPVGDLVVVERREEDWANAWKDHYHPVRVGQRVTVRPPWRDYHGDLDELVIVLDPGMAFGTGTHPTTRLSMSAIEFQLRPGDHVLDVGTGSGVLAIGAARLGAAAVDACDIEPVAVRQAQDNVARNEVAETVSVAHGTAGQDGPFPGTYDLVVANIIARVLAELADGISGHVSEEGTLILSGIIEERESLVLDAYQAHGFHVVARDQIEDWVGLVLRR